MEQNNARGINHQDDKQKDLLTNKSDGTNKVLTTNQGVKINDDNNSLKAGERGPSLLEDFILREKITHFDHERIPERIVHARGSGAHGYFEVTNPIPQFTVRGNTLKDKMLGNNAEINPWKTFYPSTLLQSIHYFETGNVKNAVTTLRKFILELQNPTMDYHQKRELLINSKFDYILNSKIYAFLYQLPDSTQSLETWTSTCIRILADHFTIDATEIFAFKVKINGFKWLN